MTTTKRSTKLSPSRAMPATPPKLNPADFAKIGPEDLPMSSDGVKLLAAVRLFWLRRRRLPTVGEIRALLKWGRTRVYDARAEIEGKPMLRPVQNSGPQSEIADQRSEIADQESAPSVRNSGPADARTRMDSGDSRRVETPSSNLNSIEEAEKKTKSARRLPLPDWFGELSAGLDKLDDYDRKMVTNLSAAPDALITAAQMTKLTRIRALVKLEPWRQPGIGGLDTSEDRAAFKRTMDAKMRRLGMIR